MGYNADDPKQVKAAKKQAEFDEALKLDVIKGVMSTIRGRQWIYDMLNSAHIFSTTFIMGSPDGSAFAEGERNHGLRLLVDVQNAAPDLYLLMVQEAKGTTS